MIFLISEKRYFHFCFFFYSSRENEWGVNCPNRVKNGQDTDFQSLLIAQLFLQPAVYIGYWIDGTQAGRRPIGHTCVSRRLHPCAIIRPLRFMYASICAIGSTCHFWHSFSVQPPPFSGKKITQFSKFEVVESKYRRFNRARWQLTAKKCDQKFPFGSNSTSRCRRETKDIAPWSSALRLSCAMLGLIVLAMPLTPRPLKKKRYVCATAPHTLNGGHV